MNKQQLSAKIWQSANKMRSKIEANDYKDYILGFLFYKFISEQQEKFLRNNAFTDKDIRESLNENNREVVEFVQLDSGCFIAYEHLFSTWINKGKDFDVSNVRDALSAFSRLIHPSHKKVYEGIFDTLHTGLSKLGDNSNTQTKAISDLIHLIDEIPMNGRHDYDVLGFIYEYLIGMFAANAGKKAGEFYTPHEVSLLISEIIAHHLKDRETIKIYDPTSGSGSLLINIGHSVSKNLKSKDSIKYYAQELKENTYNLTRMNLIMRGINPSNIVTRNADTLEDDWPYFDDADPVGTYEPLYVDAVVSNPPYSQAWDSSHKQSDPRYADFGLAPKTKADFAFLLHDLYHLKTEGMMAIVLPHGVLFRGGEEERIRTNLIEKNHIDAIIGLPANIFFGTGIPTIIMILRKNRKNSDVLFVDASKEFIKEGKQNKLQAAHIRKIVDTVTERKNIEKFSRVVTLAEIKEQGYNLNIPRYVDSSEPAETYDIYATLLGGIPQSEIHALDRYWQVFPSLQKQLFIANGDTPYARLNTTNVAHTIEHNSDVEQFKYRITETFGDYYAYLKTQLIEPMSALSIAQTEEQLTQDLFTRFSGHSLIDPYHAYQHFADQWQIIAGDLEMIQTEGITAITQVDPHMVIKKKNGKEIEEQDGYIGHILPFELVQQHYFKTELEQLQQQENRQSQISAELDGLIENLTEEDKDSPAVNETGDGFIPAEIPKALKISIEADLGTLSKAQLTEKLSNHAFAEDSLETKLQTALKLLAEDKALKAAIKTAANQLHIQSKNKLESLSPAEAQTLLADKWITPLQSLMLAQPNAVLKQLVNRVQHLADKYADTLTQISTELHSAEYALAQLLGELEGDAYDLQGINALKKLLGG